MENFINDQIENGIEKAMERQLLIDAILNYYKLLGYKFINGDKKHTEDVKKLSTTMLKIHLDALANEYSSTTDY